METVIETRKTYCCSRCNSSTGSEEHMRAHILDRQCEKGAQYYTVREG